LIQVPKANKTLLKIFTAFRRLYVINNKLEKESKRQSCLDLFGAEQRLRTLDNIQCEIDGIVEEALANQTYEILPIRRLYFPSQLQLLVQIRHAQIRSLTEDRVCCMQFSPLARAKPKFDQVPSVAGYEITNQTAAYQATRATYSSGSADRHDTVTVKAHRGNFGKLPVMYTTYCSRSDNNSASKVLTLFHTTQT
jgi:hypothetical protein